MGGVLRIRLCVLLVLPLILSTFGIKVPVDNDTSEENVPENDGLEKPTKQSPSKPIYYTSDEPVDSYLIPPNQHRPEEVLPDTVITPATYLLPPTQEKQTNYYYAPVESDDQSDWYPIAQQQPHNLQVQLLPPKQQTPVIPIFLSGTNNSKPFDVVQQVRTGKLLGDRLSLPIPSVKLEPPAEDAPNDYIIQIPSEELELPAEEIDHLYRPVEGNPKEVHQPIASNRKPPKPHLRKFKNPTKLYPKKFNGGGFKPVPIPIGQFADDLSSEVPKAKPAKYFQPLPGIEQALPLEDEKAIYRYEQAEQKRKLKDSEESQSQDDVSSTKYVEVPPTEQDASESYRYPARNVYPAPYHAPGPYRGEPTPYRQPAPLIVAPHAPPAPRPEANPQPQAPPAPDDRTEFRMHGMKGPHSYQFGYDTGKGKNRQFRYEERDNDGLVKGHYGYMDRHGKLRVVNYSAHPELGFQASPQEESKE